MCVFSHSSGGRAGVPFKHGQFCSSEDRGALSWVTRLWYTMCARFLWPRLRHISLVSAMGYSIWICFPVLVELCLSSDIHFSTGGAAGMSFYSFAAGMAFCSFALRMSFYVLAFHALVGSQFKHDLSVLKNPIIGLIFGSFNAAWTWICFCMSICIPWTASHFKKVSFKQYSFWTVGSFFLQAVLQVSRGLQRAVVGQILQDWFITLVDGRIVHSMQSSKIFLVWSRVRQQLEARCTKWRPTHSMILLVLSLHRSTYESRTISFSALRLYWLGFSLRGRRLFRSSPEAPLFILHCNFGNLQQLVQNFSGNFFLVLLAFYSSVDKVFHLDHGFCKHGLYAQRLLGWCACLQCWPIFYLVTVQLADGADSDFYSSDGPIECPWPGSESSEHGRASTSWLLPLLCSAICLLATWVLRRWWKFLPPAFVVEGLDDATMGPMFDRVNVEIDSLRREVSFLDGQLSEFSSVVRRFREDLYEFSAVHERLAEQVEMQHVGMVRLGGFSPFQMLSIDQRQQVFARERRNMMAYRSVGPDQFMATVLHQDRLLGLRSDFTVVGGVGARLDYPRGESPAENHPLIEFNDVGDGSGLPQDVLWAIARNKLQIELYNCLVREDFATARLFQQTLLFFIDVSHQDRTLDRQDQEHLFAGLGDRLESLSEGLRGEDDSRAECYLALAARFRAVALSRPTWVI